MCTLIAAVRQYSRFPLVVAANRDEALNRPATAPRLWTEPARFVAPRDEQAGGTWLGLTATGLFVAVTNRFGVERDLSRKSRGALVVDALTTASARDLHERMANLRPGDFNAFHLLYADVQHAFVTWSDGTTLRQETLTPGLHIVTERSVGGDDHARPELIRREYPAGSGDAPPTVSALGAMLARHAEDPVSATCVHLDALGYGTRSSLVLRLSEKLDESDFAWAEGRPCQHPLIPKPDLIAALTARAP